MLKDRFYYKDKAKELMVGKYDNVIIITIIFSLIQSFISYGMSETRTKYRNMQIIQQGNPLLFSIFSIINFVFGAIVIFSLIKMYKTVVSNVKPNIEETIFFGFKNNVVTVVLLTFIQGIFLTLWTLLFVIPGIVKTYSYSMSYYLVYRQPNLGPIDAISRSNNMTKGYKMQLFELDLSYVLWYVLGLFTLGILWLWIVPKHQTARMLMFDDIYARYYPEKVETVEAEF